jgi:hypothetical protein
LSGHPTVALIVALLVLTYASQYSPSAVSKLKDRILRNERWFIQDTAQAANALTNARGKIAKLWHVHEGFETNLVQRLNVLARSTQL